MFSPKPNPPALFLFFLWRQKEPKTACPIKRSNRVLPTRPDPLCGYDIIHLKSRLCTPAQRARSSVLRACP